MYYDLIFGDWETAFSYHSSNSKEIVVRQAPFGIVMVAVESFCRIFTGELLDQCSAAWMRIHEICFVINFRSSCRW